MSDPDCSIYDPDSILHIYWVFPSVLHLSPPPLTPLRRVSFHTLRPAARTTPSGTDSPKIGKMAGLSLQPTASTSSTEEAIFGETGQGDKMEETSGDVQM